MPKLPWVDDPRIVSQAIVDNRLRYVVSFPAIGKIDGFEGMALKITDAGMPIQYSVKGGPFNRDNDAQVACQADYDEFDHSVPPEYQPKPPEPSEP